jgi:hypothetical protein
MNKPGDRSSNTALASTAHRELLSSTAKRRSVKPASKRWQPPEGLSPEAFERSQITGANRGTPGNCQGIVIAH